MREGEPHFEKEPVKSEKEVLWEKTEQQLEKYRGIEKGITDTVVGLNVFGIETVNSCEGHYNHGRIAPWVSIEKWEGKPRERYIGQKKFEQEFYERCGVTELNKNYSDYLKEFDKRKAGILGPERVEPDSEKVGRRIAEMGEEVEKKYGITPKITKKWMDTGIRADKEVEEAGKDGRLQETEEYKKWNAENDAMKNNVQQLLDEFYKDREVPKNNRVIIDQDGTGSWCIHNGGEDYYDVTRRQDEIPDADKKHHQEILDRKNSQKEQGEIERRVENYRAEFQGFATFLKEKHFAE